MHTRILRLAPGVSPNEDFLRFVIPSVVGVEHNNDIGSLVNRWIRYLKIKIEIVLAAFTTDVNRSLAISKRHKRRIAVLEC